MSRLSLSAEQVVFTLRDAEAAPHAHHLTLENPRGRGLASRLPRFAHGQPIACVAIPDLPSGVQGFWSLWRIAISATDWARERVMPLFLHDDGRVLLPTAQYVWDQLLSDAGELHGHLDGPGALSTYERLWEVAEAQSKPVYQELVQAHRERVRREREKADYAFAARRRAAERIGLPAVRSYRLSRLGQEERDWLQELDRQCEVIPEMIPLLLVRITGG